MSEGQQRRVALVTGGTQGIGLAIAAALVDAGWTVAVQGLDDPAALRHVHATLPDASIFAADLAAPGAAAALLAQAKASCGDPDLVVHCASAEMRRPLLDFDRAEAERQMAVNLWAGIELITGALPAMMARGWGRIIAIGSVQQAKPHPDMLAYAASKAALANAVRNVARQVAGHGITANILAPGATLTPRTAGVLSDPDYAARVLANIPAGRFGTPEDMVGAALMLVGDAGAYINGQTIFVDGLMSF
ncbi:SDR family NAD(P)-dependent oxidoreductase [Sphingomonas sp. CJ99]